MAASGASMPFVKNLASSDRKIRTQALDTLKAFLSAKYAAIGGSPSAATTLTFHDAHKLWAGLFYALWMADRAPAQQRLCDELAGLPAAVGLPDAAVAVWLQAFWATMARQWTTGIDVLRMDKFLLLVRRVLGAQLAWMAGTAAEQEKSKKKGKAETEAETEAARRGYGVLAEWPLNPEAETPIEDVDEDEDDAAAAGWKRSIAQATLKIPVGLTLHVLDIWVDELERLGLLDAARASPLPRRINALVATLAAQTTAPATRKHAREALADERLPWTPKAAAADGGGIEGQGGEDADTADDASWDGFND